MWVSNTTKHRAVSALKINIGHLLAEKIVSKCPKVENSKGIEILFLDKLSFSTRYIDAWCYR